MKRIESIEDDAKGVVTYEFSDGRRLTLAVDYVRGVGIAEAARQAGLGHLVPTERVSVMQAGRIIGTLSPDFDSTFIRSMS